MQAFLDATGATYPVLQQAGYLQSAGTASMPLYGIRYDNYVVVDALGIVRYTSVSEVFTGLGQFHDAHLRTAIRQSLATVSVAPTSWSAVKELYRTSR